QTFNVNGIEYWFGAGTADGDLVIKGSGILTSTYVGFGSGSHTLTGEAALTYNSTTNTVFLDDGTINVQGPNNGTALLVEDDIGNNLINAQEVAGATYVDITVTGNAGINASGLAFLVGNGGVGLSTGAGGININPNGSWEINGSTGTSGQAIVSNGSGSTPTWQTVATTPGGSNTQIQFNNSSAFGGDADLTFTGGNQLNATNLAVGSLTSGRIPFASTSGLLIDETALQYNTTNNSIVIVGSGGTTTTTVFGGEIQLDDVGNSDDLTLNNSSIISTGNSSFSVGNASGPLTLTSSSGNLSVTAVGGLVAGTYSPTLTNVANVSSSTAGVCHYSRVGNEVTMAIRVSITTTAAASTTLAVSLPIASNFTAVDDVVGMGMGWNNLIPALADADFTNDRIEIDFTGMGAGQTNTFLINLMYTVK
ncbi:MAG TPA: hypothetical protein VGD31_17205, partial [Sphingobacteriaceae bacterium]